MNSPSASKIFVSEKEHIADSYRLGATIFGSGYRPTFVLGVWRGGSTVALAVQECLAYLGVATNHITVRTSYEGRDQYETSLKSKEKIRVHGKSYALESITADDRLLIVDDVYRSGRHTRAVVDKLSEGLRRNMPKDVRVAALWKHTDVTAPDPDYFLHETDQWVVLPYEMRGISEDELRTHKPFLSELLP
ncbi:MAG: hypoxanthine phosphoribosyltransferase [Gammaproteobacteria bacterium]|nr:hypoxanthine phosphoribosyltransferase [Gammaproteobacteria bacterium]